jgi:ribosome modulation factor
MRNIDITDAAAVYGQGYEDYNTHGRFRLCPYQTGSVQATWFRAGQWGAFTEARNAVIERAAQWAQRGTRALPACPQEALDLGITAAEQGAARSTNPYEDDTVGHTAWLQGWEAYHHA